MTARTPWPHASLCARHCAHVTTARRLVLAHSALCATVQWWPGSRSDPYAVVSVGGSSGRTPTLKATLEPRWEHTVVLYVRDPQEQRLLVRVLDEDLDSDDLLGAGG